MRLSLKPFFLLLTILLTFAAMGQNAVHSVNYLPASSSWPIPKDAQDFLFKYQVYGQPLEGVLKVQAKKGKVNWIGLEMDPKGNEWLSSTSFAFEQISSVAGELYAVSGNDIIRLSLSEDQILLKQLEHYNDETKASTVLNFSKVEGFEEQQVLAEPELVEKEKEKLLGTFDQVIDSISQQTPAEDPPVAEPVVTAAKAEQKPITDTLFHVVAAGENLYRIGLKYGLKPPQIIEMNGMTDARIAIGQKLIVGIEQQVAANAPVSLPEPEPEPVLELEADSSAVVEEVVKATVKEDPVIEQAMEKDVPQTDSLVLPATVEVVQEVSSPVEQPVAAKKVSVIKADNFDGNLQLAAAAKVEDLTKEAISEYMSSNLRDTLALKEYFFFYIDPQGEVDSVQDQRTATNKNSSYLQPADLTTMKGFSFEPTEQSAMAQLPIGMELDALRVRYNVKITEDNIRLYNIPLYFEYIKPEHPHYQLIMQELQNSQKPYGRYEVRIVEGASSLLRFERKEYNPFASASDTLYHAPFSYIESFTPME